MTHRLPFLITSKLFLGHVRITSYMGQKAEAVDDLYSRLYSLGVGLHFFQRPTGSWQISNDPCIVIKQILPLFIGPYPCGDLCSDLRAGERRAAHSQILFRA